MTGELYPGDPLTPSQREEFEEDLIVFSDRELDLLGDLAGLDVLYAGGWSLLWVEGLAERVGKTGSVTALDVDEGRLASAAEDLREADLPAPARLVVGDVFEPPFDPGSFDLVYSAGVFHELDVGERFADEALAALASMARPGGRVATGDFVDTVPAVQLEDEALDAELAREASGGRLFGIGAPERLVALHEGVLSGVRWQVSPPFPVRHLDKIVLAEREPAWLYGLAPEVAGRLRERRESLRRRIAREGYTRPATAYVEGTRRNG